MKTFMAAILVFIIMMIPLAICAVTNTENVLFLAPSIIWVYVCPLLVLIFYDKIDAAFSKGGK